MELAEMVICVEYQERKMLTKNVACYVYHYPQGNIGSGTAGYLTVGTVPIEGGESSHLDSDDEEV
jgi:hypothetical protein